MVCMPSYSDVATLHATPLLFGDYYLCMVNTLLFASGRRTGTVVTRIRTPKKIEQGAMNMMIFRMDIFHEGTTEPMNVHIRYRDEKNAVVFESVDAYHINKGNSFIQVNYPLLPIGRYSIDVSISDADGVGSLGGCHREHRRNGDGDDGLCARALQDR